MEQMAKLFTGPYQDGKRRSDHDRADRAAKHDHGGSDLSDIPQPAAFHYQAADDSAYRKNQSADGGEVGFWEVFQAFQVTYGNLPYTLG